MLQTLKTLLDDHKERSMNLGIEINQDADEVMTEEDLPAEAEIGRNGSIGEELHNKSALIHEADSGRNGSSGEHDMSDEIESVDSEPVQNEEERNEIAETIETNGGDLKEEAVGEIQTIETYGGDQAEEAVLGEIQMDHGDVNDEEISEL